MTKVSTIHTVRGPAASSGKFPEIMASRRGLFAGTLFGGVALAVPAIAASRETPVLAAFRDWVATVRRANLWGQTDEEIDRGAELIEAAEARMRGLRPADSRDWAAKGFVALYAVDGSMRLTNPVLLDDDADVNALAFGGDVIASFPELAALMQGTSS